MVTPGILETVARADLDALVSVLNHRYRPGALEAVTEVDPEWREALERAERDVGQMYAALREADSALGRWREALVELSRLWARVGAGPVVLAGSGEVGPPLRDVA